MITKVGNVSARVLLIAMSAGCITAITAAAWAAPPPSPPAAGTTIEGCDQKVLDAAQAKARALVVFDKATTAESVVQPDSQLALDCFNNIGGIYENEGGTLFSGPLNGHWSSTGITYPYNKSTPPVWTTDTYYSDDIEDPLNGFYDDFAQAIGNKGGTVDYTQTTLTDTPNCTEQQDLWGDPPGGTPTPGPGSQRGQGEQGGVPFVDDDALTNTTPLTNTGTNFQQEITTDTADLTAYNTALNALAPANIKPVIPAFTDGTIGVGQNNSCSVLLAAGATTSCP